MIPILNPYTRQPVAVPLAPPRQQYQPPPTPAAAAAAAPVTSLVGNGEQLAAPPTAAPELPPPAAPATQPEVEKEEVEPIIDISSMGSNISGALAQLKGGDGGGLNLNLCAMDESELSRPAPEPEPVEEPTPVPSPAAAPEPAPVVPSPVPSPALAPATSPVPSPALTPAPVSISPSPPLKPSHTPVEEDWGDDGDVEPDAVEQDIVDDTPVPEDTGPKPWARGWERKAESSDPPLGAPAVPAPEPAAPAPVAGVTLEHKPSWADDDTDFENALLSGPVSLADRLRLTGPAPNSKRAQQIFEMQQREENRVRQKQWDKEASMRAAAAAIEEAKQREIAERAARAAALARPAPPPVQYAPPRREAPKKVAVPVDEWGVVMSKKTLNSVAKQSSTSPFVVAAEVKGQPEKKPKNKKPNSEAPPVIQTVRLSEEELKPYKNKVRNLMKKVREIEQLESGGVTTDAQKAKVAKKSQLVRELADAEKEFTKFGGVL